MSKLAVSIPVNIGIKEIKSILARLPIKTKIKILKEMEKDTMQLRWNNLFKEIDARLKSKKISQKDIANEIKFSHIKRR